MGTTTQAADTARLTIDVWADVLCPWCYLGEQRLDAAVEQSGHAGDIDLKARTFQLDPDAPAGVVATLDYLSRKYGVPAAQARSMEEGMARQAASEGLKYEVNRPASSTFDLLRLVKLGDRHGVSWQYLRGMQAEVFGGNFDAFGHATLISIGEGLGIPGQEIRDVLATGRYGEQVRADHATAVAMGARGVPFTVLGQRLGIPGAVSTSQYADAISQAWERLNG